MLKRVLFSVVVIGAISFFCASSQAAPTNGTDPVVAGRLWALAVEYDYIYERDLESSEITEGRIDEANTAYAKLTFKPSKYLSLYGKAGISNFRTDVKLNNGKTIKEEYDTGFYTGGGGRVICELGPKFKVCVDNQFSWWNCGIDSLEYGGVLATTVSDDTAAWEYQISGILSYKIDWQNVIHPIQGEYPALIPYIGAKYACLEIDSDVTAAGPDFSISPPDKRKNDRKLGIVCGLDIDFLSLYGFSFNIEGRFLDETAISGFISYNF